MNEGGEIQGYVSGRRDTKVYGREEVRYKGTCGWEK